MKHHTFEDGLKYRPDYEWPEPGTEKKCPKCQRELELVENSPSYYGKPWWCYNCLLYTSPSPRDVEESRMPSSA